MKTTHYLCDLITKKVSFAGPLPEVWGCLTSLPPEGDPDLLDLTWAGHPNTAFLNYQQAIIEGIDPQSLAALRITVMEPVWRDIQDRRDENFLGGVSVAGKWFHTDDSSRSKYLELKDQARDIIASGGTMDSPIIGSDGKQREWKTKDGSTIGLTCKIVYDVVDAARNHHDAVFSTAERHRLAMAEAIDPVLYDYSRNWPSSFGI